MLNFFKKNKNITNDNGLNKIYSNKGKGILVHEFYKINGQINGECKSFNPYNGKLESIENYKNGVLNGEKKIYSNDGEIIDILNYENGDRIPTVKDFKLKDKYKSIKKFIAKINVINNKFGLDFYEILQMSRDEIDIKCDSISMLSGHNKQDIFYYIAYKRMFGLERLLTETKKEDLKKPVNLNKEKIESQFKENFKVIQSEMNVQLSYFDKKGVYKPEKSHLRISPAFTAANDLWEKYYKNYIRDIYTENPFDGSYTFLGVDEYFKILNKTDNQLFYLSMSQYISIKLIFYKCHQHISSFDWSLNLNGLNKDEKIDIDKVYNNINEIIKNDSKQKN